MGGPAAMEVKYQPGLLRTVRSECSENARGLDHVINDILLEVFEDKPINSVMETLSGLQSSLQRLGATLAREVQLLKSMEAKASELRIKFTSNSSYPDDQSPAVVNVLQTTFQPQTSMFRGLSARYPSIGEDYEVTIKYGPPLLRRIRRRCTDDAASQALTINEVLQDQFAIEPQPMKVEILSNFEESLRSVRATLTLEVTILDSMERKAAELRQIFEKKVSTMSESEEVFAKEEGGAPRDECLPDPIFPDHNSSKAPPLTEENAHQPPMTPKEVAKLLKILPLRAATLKGYNFSFTKGFMNGVLHLCALILELDTKKFANVDAKDIVDACFKAAGQPYELVFIPAGPGLLKMNFAKLPNKGSAPKPTAQVATPSAPVTQNAPEGPLSNVGKTSDHQELAEIIDSIEQVSPNVEGASHGTAWGDGDDDAMIDILSTVEVDAQSARFIITEKQGSSTVLALEHVLETRETDASVGAIPVEDNVHGLPTTQARPSLDEREHDVLRRFTTEYDHLESPSESYLVAGTFNERRKRRELAMEALGILLRKHSLVPTISKEAEAYLLFKFTDHRSDNCLEADGMPQNHRRNENIDEEIHSPETSIEHGDRKPESSRISCSPTFVVPSKKEVVDLFNYDATPPPQKDSLSSKVSDAKALAHNSSSPSQSSQRRQKRLFAPATETAVLTSPVSGPENSFDDGEESDGHVIDGGSVHLDEERGSSSRKKEVTRGELFAAIERNWGFSVDDVCTRPLWRQSPGRRLLKLLVRLSEVCTLKDVNAQLRAEIRIRRSRDRNFQYVNDSVLRSLLVVNESLRAQRNEDEDPSGADLPKTLPQIGSAGDKSVPIGDTGAHGETEAFGVDQDEYVMAEQDYDTGEDERRKRLYTAEEVDLLGRLKDQGKSWQEIVESFEPFRRTLSSLQFKWSSRPRVRAQLEAPERTIHEDSHGHDAAASLKGEIAKECDDGPSRPVAATGPAARETGVALQQWEMPAPTEKIPEGISHQTRNRSRRNRYTSDEIELLFRLKREKKTWTQIEESFKDTTHTMCSLQSKYQMLKSDINDTVRLVSESLDESAPVESGTREHVNIMDGPCEGAVTSAPMGEAIDYGVVSEAEARPDNTYLLAPPLPDPNLGSCETSLTTTLSSRLPMAFSKIMNSSCYWYFKNMMKNHEDELPEGQFHRVVDWGTEKLQRENVQSAERLGAIADALWVSIVSHETSSLEDKWMAIGALDGAFTHYVVSHGGFGLVDVKKKVLTHKFGRTRKACTPGAHDTNEIVRQMLDANPRPEKRRHVEEAIEIAHIYIGHAQTAVEIETRAYDLFEAIIYRCRHNSKVKQSAVSSLAIALERCLDVARNLALPQGSMASQITEAPNNEAAVMLSNGTSHQGAITDNETIELPVNISTPSVLNEGRGRVIDSTNDGSSNHATLSQGLAPSAAIEGLDFASMRAASPPPIRTEPPALTSAKSPVITVRAQHPPPKDIPLLCPDEVKQVVDAILQHPLAEARTFASKFVTKVFEGRDANTLAKILAISQLLEKGLKEYSGMDVITSPGYLGLNEAVREHIKHIQGSSALNKGFLDKSAEIYSTVPTSSGETLLEPERGSALLPTPLLSNEPSPSVTNKADTQSVASAHCASPSPPPVTWKGSAIAITESTEEILPAPVSDTPHQPLSATHSLEQPPPIFNERANSDSSAPLLKKSGIIADSSNAAIVHDQNRRGAIETLEKAFVWALSDLEDTGHFSGRNPQQTAQTLAFSLEQAIHNSSIGKYVYLRQVGTYSNAIDGYSGWTKRLLDNPEYVEALVHMSAEKLSKETRLRRTKYSRMAEELAAKKQLSAEKDMAQMSAKPRALQPLLSSRQYQRRTPSQRSSPQPQTSNTEGSLIRSPRSVKASGSPGQDNLTQALSTSDGGQRSHKRASSAILNASSSKRMRKAGGPRKYADFALREEFGAFEYTPSECMLSCGTSTSPTKPKRKRATQSISHANPRTISEVTNQPRPSMPILFGDKILAATQGTKGAVLSETPETVPTANSAQKSGSTSQPQHESSKRRRRGWPSTLDQPSAPQPHKSGSAPPASTPPAATPEQEMQTLTTWPPDGTPPAAVAAGQYQTHYVPQLPEASAVLRPGEFHNHYIRPPIPSQPQPLPSSTPTPAPAPSHDNHSTLQQDSKAIDGLVFISIKPHMHDFSSLPDIPAEEIPTAYDDIYEEFPPGLNIETPTRQPSPVLSAMTLPFSSLSNVLPSEGLDPSGFLWPQNERGEVNRETWGFITRQTPPPGPEIGCKRRKMRKEERAKLVEMELEMWRDENGEIKEEALIVPWHP